MVNLFSKKGRGPIKFAGYDFIGQHPDYDEVFYYCKELPNYNYDLLEAKMERIGFRKYSLCSGTTVKTLDSFMSYYLYAKKNLPFNFGSVKEFVKYAVEFIFKEIEDKDKDTLIKRYTAKVPKEIEIMDSYRDAIKDGYSLLYCSDTEDASKKFSQVSLVLYKNVEIDGFNIHRKYTTFKPLFFMTKPSFVKKEKLVKYQEVPLPDINVCDDLIN